MKMNSGGRSGNEHKSASKMENSHAPQKDHVTGIQVTRVNGSDSRLSQEDIERFREILLSKRQQLIGDVDHMKDEALHESRKDAAGDLSSMPIHMADIGSDNFEQEFTLDLIQNEQTLLKEIDEALQRIDKGTYGICIATGKPIGKARLKLKPWAKYSIEYVRRMEKGQESK